MIKSVSIDEFLQRVSSQSESNIWSALVVTPSDFDEVIEHLREIISIFVECEVIDISGKDGVSNLIEKVQEASEDYLILWDFESWNRENWPEFDYARSWLDKHKRGGVLVLSPKSAGAMFNYAPNIASWLGSRVYDVNKNSELLTEEEQETRLSALREWFGLSDSEVIELGEARKLPLDPEYGEWLVLLDREDLIERSK
ncbi:MAG: ABC transporter permease [Symploca sp. SIO2E9]|nr:ABC transporter permease [Symploca sp. SIO2E9]